MSTESHWVQSTTANNVWYFKELAANTTPSSGLFFIAMALEKHKKDDRPWVVTTYRSRVELPGNTSLADAQAAAVAIYRME